MNHLTANTPLALFIVTKHIGSNTEAIIWLNMLSNIASTNFWAQVKTVSPLDLVVAPLGLATAAAPLGLMLAWLHRMQTLLLSLLPWWAWSSTVLPHSLPGLPTRCPWKRLRSALYTLHPTSSSPAIEPATPVHTPNTSMMLLTTLMPRLGLKGRSCTKVKLDLYLKYWDFSVNTDSCFLQVTPVGTLRFQHAAERWQNKCDQ